MKYQDKVFYLTSLLKIKEVVFSEYWDYTMAYIYEDGHQEIVEESRLYKSKKDALLAKIEELKTNIQVNKNVILNCKKEIPILEEQLKETIKETK